MALLLSPRQSLYKEKEEEAAAERNGENPSGHRLSVALATSKEYIISRADRRKKMANGPRIPNIWTPTNESTWLPHVKSRRHFARSDH
jgi:hypothetical protein